MYLPGGAVRTVLVPVQIVTLTTRTTPAGPKITITIPNVAGFQHYSIYSTGFSDSILQD